ncbi:hypothetical protein J1605_012760 [Eschrichtius robustus]|uniref:Cilia- and flagella-associated protein 251 n=1 Tax=Eschrichtius robustus TaxID=9764 RepID=A0AB34GH45_ESCRO|nr:hypothetical protein J1605_012760 [Eschrichtius robustus]
MSDAEENPLEETEEYGEIEMEEGEDEEEEEKYPNDEGLENMQQELKEDNTLAWRGSQEEGEEEGEEGEEEEEEGEGEKRVGEQEEEEEREGEEEGEEFGKEEEAVREEVEEETMTWSFGWNSSLPVYYIQDENQRVLLYASAHTAVIYNVFKNNQHHLQAHPNVISCLCISEDRRWVATADKGPDCLIIIWDCFSGIPVHTIFDSCPEGDGIRAMAITRDAKYLATISDAEIQVQGLSRQLQRLARPSQVSPRAALLRPCGVCGSLGGGG